MAVRVRRRGLEVEALARGELADRGRLARAVAGPQRAAGVDAVDDLAGGADGAVETVRATGTVCAADDVLAEAYEMVLFDGERELRWLRTPDGRGPAIAIGEEPADLPPGQDVTADPPPQRGDTHTRLLAGVPRRHGAADWTTLDRDSKRYAAAHLPLTFTGGDLLVIDTVEYLVEDEHGNVDVADTRTLGLRTTTMAAVCVVAAATTSGQERTTA